MFINLSYKSNLDKRKAHFQFFEKIQVYLFNFLNNKKDFNLHFFFKCMLSKTKSKILPTQPLGLLEFGKTSFSIDFKKFIIINNCILNIIITIPIYTFL